MKLHSAAEEGDHLELQRLIEEEGYDYNQRDDSNNTPLHYARRRDLTIVKKLLQYPDIDVNAQDTNGRTPLMLSCSKVLDDKTIAKELLKHPQIDVNVKDNDESSCMNFPYSILSFIFSLDYIRNQFINESYFFPIEYSSSHCFTGISCRCCKESPSESERQSRSI
eukprot:gb/GECH01010479.1/.p1 GENE.gb/GECH01010479.1/~~gb/GECH01010479.1/.p1  ORF type:complete len:166 (+),score=20.81 gb/GECH01010479.1/:1-498(+)